MWSLMKLPSHADSKTSFVHLKQVEDVFQWIYADTPTYTYCLGNLTTSTITENTTELLSAAAHEIFIAVLEVNELYLSQIVTTTRSFQ